MHKGPNFTISSNIISETIILNAKCHHFRRPVTHDCDGDSDCHRNPDGLGVGVTTGIAVIVVMLLFLRWRKRRLATPPVEKKRGPRRHNGSRDKIGKAVNFTNTDDKTVPRISHFTCAPLCFAHHTDDAIRPDIADQNLPLYP
ncbi:hypothetical protein BC938DRAFT_471156 [Jimgerdemannia flammicorona]|uniref:Uncharacterized protein n=1 Tax=Jimgerdemannia flammicorona TaxID=994334 RepID=A0A433QUV6_9FUNG|nr:hypothetical protein BC938DRAFT_471156 [Jimgerdemannia flammicorona]